MTYCKISGFLVEGCFDGIIVNGIIWMGLMCAQSRVATWTNHHHEKQGDEKLFKIHYRYILVIKS